MNKDEIRSDFNGLADYRNSWCNGNKNTGTFTVRISSYDNITGAAVPDIRVISKYFINYFLNGHNSFSFYIIILD